MADVSEEDKTVLQSTSSCPLLELTAKTCGVGVWILRVVQPRVVEYTYTWQSQQRQGKKAEYILLSEDSNVYCMGVVKCIGSSDTADKNFQAQVNKFKNGTMWSMSRITLSPDKPEYIGSPVKLVIDLTKTKLSPVLETAGFPRTPTPPESLATIVQLSRPQKIDFLALINIGEKHRSVVTRIGERNIIDVTFLDGSKLANEKMVTITTSMFFPSTKAGEALLQQLRGRDNKPVAVFGAMCSRVDGKVNVSLGQDAYWLSCDSGPKADRLTALGQESRSKQDVEEISAQWTPQEARNFKEEPATQTTCALLNTILNHSDSTEEMLFQVNHVRIMEPGCGENVKTNDGARLFVPVRLMDFTGVVQLRMRQQAALELSGMDSVEEFGKSCSEACLRFPLLSSVRVYVRPKPQGAAEHLAPSQSESSEVSAMVVEASMQLCDATCAPNNALLELYSMLSKLAMPSSRMIAARVRDITVAPHAGMSVKIDDTVSIVAEYVLVLIAATEISRGQSFSNGYRVVTKKVVDIDFWESGADISDAAECVSICTTDNLMYYKMAPARPGSRQYALALVSGFRAATESSPCILMIDYVDSFDTSIIDDYKKMLRKLATLAKGATFATNPPKRPLWSPTRTPHSAKKTKKLSYHPTDESLSEMEPPAQQ